MPQLGSARSEINLLGLGEARTLVLIGGHRMPRIPEGGSTLVQSDLNPIPLSSIARIDTLTSAASGIYGPGAIGGVVNVVLRHDYAVPEIHVTR